MTTPPACATLCADQTSEQTTGLVTRVGNGPHPQCDAEQEMGPSPFSSSHWWVLFRDLHTTSFISASSERAPVL